MHRAESIVNELKMDSDSIWAYHGNGDCGTLLGSAYCDVPVCAGTLSCRSTTCLSANSTRDHQVIGTGQRKPILLLSGRFLPQRGGKCMERELYGVMEPWKRKGMEQESYPGNGIAIGIALVPCLSRFHRSISPDSSHSMPFPLRRGRSLPDTRRMGVC